MQGQLGDGTNDDSNVPVAVMGISNAEILGLGGRQSCALLDDGIVLCWGRNAEGQLGDGTNTDSNVPVQVTF